MKILNEIQQKTDEWLNSRLGNLTGTRTKALCGSKTVFDNLLFELASERLSKPIQDLDGIDPRDRGEILEPECISAFTLETGLPVYKTGLVTSGSHTGQISPDGLSSNEPFDPPTYAVEAKCLEPKGWLRNVYNHKKDGTIPPDYIHQCAHYFVICDTVEIVYLCLYAPEYGDKALHIIPITKADVATEIKEIQENSLKMEKAIEEIIKAMVL